MSKIKLVTSRQGQMVVDMANGKGIGREMFQGSLDNGDIARFLDSLKTGTVGITAPEGARIYELHLRVKLDGDWQTSVNEAGPNTPLGYNIRKVADRYPPTGTGEVESDYILLNYPHGDGNRNKALAWAKGAKLQNTFPREAFAVGKWFPTLHRTLGLDPMYVVATTDCTFDDIHQDCFVWWRGSGRGADLGWVSGFNRSSVCWFLFRK